MMVVSDPTNESINALQYTLSHAMHENDDVILMHVTHSKKAMSIKSFFRRRNSDPGLTDISNFDAANEGRHCGGDFLDVMKKACKAAYPNSRVRVEKVEQAKGAWIVRVLLFCSGVRSWGLIYLLLANVVVLYLVS